MNQAPPPLPVRVCPKHGLVAGRDGRCVICNRGRAEAEGSRWQRQLVAWVVVFGVISGGLFLWKGFKGRRAATPEVVADTAPPARPAAAPVEEPEGPAQVRTPEDRAADRAATERERQLDIEGSMSRVRIRMFMVKSCTLCDAARDYMKQKGLTFTEIDVGDPAAFEAMAKLTTSKQVPVFDVEGEVLVGYGPLALSGAVRRAAEKRNQR